MVKQNLNSDQKPKEKRGTDPRHIALRALCAAHAAAVRGVGTTAKTGTWQQQAADAVTAELAALPESERTAYPQPAKTGRALAKMCKTAYEKLRNRRKKQGDADQGKQAAARGPAVQGMGMLVHFVMTVQQGWSEAWAENG